MTNHAPGSEAGLERCFFARTLVCFERRTENQTEDEADGSAEGSAANHVEWEVGAHVHAPYADRRGQRPGDPSAVGRQVPVDEDGESEGDHRVPRDESFPGRRGVTSADDVVDHGRRTFSGYRVLDRPTEECL